jgi:hypothetical protein
MLLAHLLGSTVYSFEIMILRSPLLLSVQFRGLKGSKEINGDE